MWLSNWYTRWLLVYYDRRVCATIHRLFDLDLDKIAYITNVHCVLVVSVSLTMTYHYMRLLHTSYTQTDSVCFFRFSITCQLLHDCLSRQKWNHYSAPSDDTIREKYVDLITAQTTKDFIMLTQVRSFVPCTQRWRMTYT